MAEINMRDKEIFHRVFTRFYAPLCQFASKYLCGREDAEDVVGGLFLKLWKQQAVFENADHARSALYQATYYGCLDHLRGRQRKVNRESAYMIQSGIVDKGFFPDMIKAEMIATIYQEIDQLPPHYAAVLRLSFQQDLTNDEIAEQLKLSLQTVKNYKYRGLELLKQRIPRDAFTLLLFFVSRYF